MAEKKIDIKQFGDDVIIDIMFLKAKEIINTVVSIDKVKKLLKGEDIKPELTLTVEKDVLHLAGSIQPKTGTQLKSMYHFFISIACICNMLIPKNKNEHKVRLMNYLGSTNEQYMHSLKTSGTLSTLTKSLNLLKDTVTKTKNLKELTQLFSFQEAVKKAYNCGEDTVLIPFSVKSMAEFLFKTSFELTKTVVSKEDYQGSAVILSAKSKEDGKELLSTKLPDNVKDFIEQLTGKSLDENHSLIKFGPDGSIILQNPDDEQDNTKEDDSDDDSESIKRHVLEMNPLFNEYCRKCDTFEFCSLASIFFKQGYSLDQIKLISSFFLSKSKTAAENMKLSTSIDSKGHYIFTAKN